MLRGMMNPIGLWGKRDVWMEGFWQGSVADLAEWRDSHNAKGWHGVVKVQHRGFLHRRRWGVLPKLHTTNREDAKLSHDMQSSSVRLTFSCPVMAILKMLVSFFFCTFLLIYFLYCWVVLLVHGNSTITAPDHSQIPVLRVATLCQLNEVFKRRDGFNLQHRVLEGLLPDCNYKNYI